MIMASQCRVFAPLSFKGSPSFIKCLMFKQFDTSLCDCESDYQTNLSFTSLHISLLHNLRGLLVILDLKDREEREYV